MPPAESPVAPLFHHRSQSLHDRLSKRFHIVLFLVPERLYRWRLEKSPHHRDKPPPDWLQAWWDHLGSVRVGAPQESGPLPSLLKRPDRPRCLWFSYP